MIQLITEGTCDAPSKAAAQINKLLKTVRPNRDTTEVAKTLAELMVDLPDGTPSPSNNPHSSAIRHSAFTPKG